MVAGAASRIKAVHLELVTVKPIEPIISSDPQKAAPVLSESPDRVVGQTIPDAKMGKVKFRFLGLGDSRELDHKDQPGQSTAGSCETVLQYGSSFHQEMILKGQPGVNDDAFTSLPEMVDPDMIIY